MKQKLAKLKLYILTHRTQSFIIGGLVLILIGGGIAAAVYYATQSQQPEVSAPKVTKKDPPKPKYYSPLTGAELDSLEATQQAVTAIMIENSPDARPHSGLQEAGIVYEAIAEGGITRYLALYQESKPELIGPVRSLREYNVDWLTPYQASVAHVGGSAAALALVRNGEYRDIDQFFNPQAYWRATDRYAPHNVYTSFERLDALNREKGFLTSEFTGFERTDGKAAAEPTATDIGVNFSSHLYNTRYVYSSSSNNYTRYLAGAPHADREKGDISPASIVAVWVNEHTVMQDGYREEIQTSGEGMATIFQNGTATEATWRKTSRTAPLELIDSEGSPVKLVRGQTWIAAVPNGKGSVTW